MEGHDPRRRWEPFLDLQREVGRLFENFEPWPAWRFPRPFPTINLYDATDRFVVTAELPGVAPEEVDLSITGETLTLRGERRRPEGIADESYRRQERPFGTWSRSVTLPDRIDPDAIAAQFAHGILTINLPKAAEARPRPIAVMAANA